MCILTKPPLSSRSALARVTNTMSIVSAILKHFEEISNDSSTLWSKVCPQLTFRSKAFCTKTSTMCLRMFTHSFSKVGACLNSDLGKFLFWWPNSHWGEKIESSPLDFLNFLQWNSLKFGRDVIPFSFPCCQFIRKIY